MSVTITITLPPDTTGGVIPGAVGALVTIVATGPPGGAGPQGPPGTGLAVAGKVTTTTSLSVTGGALVAQKINLVDDSFGDATMTLPATSNPGDWIIVEKIGGSAAAHGNVVHMTGNMRGVAGTTINLGTYREQRMFLADDSASGVWWPQVGFLLPGALDNRHAQLFPTAPTRTNINATTTVVPAPAGTSNGDYWYRMTAATCPIRPPGPGMVDAGGNAALVTLTFWMDQDGTGGRDFSIATGTGFPTVTWFGGKPSFASAGANARGLFYLVSLDGGTTYLGFPGGGSGGLGTLTRVPRNTAGGTYSAQLNDLVVADTGGGTFATQLPAANAGKGRIVFRWDAGTAAPTITLTGSDKLNNSSTSGPITPSALGRTYQLESDGTSIWTVTSAFIPASELVLQSLATAKGQVLYGSAAGVVSALAANASGTKTLQSDASGNLSWATAAGAGAGTVLAAVVYRPSSANAVAATTTSTTLTDLSAAALAASTPWTSSSTGMFDATFTAITTSVVMRVTLYLSITAGTGNAIKFATYDVGAAALIANTSSQILSATDATRPSPQVRVTYEETITGLTVGNSYTYRPQWAVVSGGTASCNSGGNNGSVRVSVTAA